MSEIPDRGQKGPLKAGVSEIELKPPLGLATGDGAPSAKGHLTPLYVKALVLENGHDAVAVVTLDMLGIDRPDAQRAARLAQERSAKSRGGTGGVPAHGIIMACSHTHVAPSMLPTLHTYRTTFNPDFDAAAMQRERDWVDHVIDTIASVELDPFRKRQRAVAHVNNQGVIQTEPVKHDPCEGPGVDLQIWQVRRVVDEHIDQVRIVVEARLGVCQRWYAGVPHESHDIAVVVSGDLQFQSLIEF